MAPNFRKVDVDYAPGNRDESEGSLQMGEWGQHFTCSLETIFSGRANVGPLNFLSKVSPWKAGVGVGGRN